MPTTKGELLEALNVQIGSRYVSSEYMDALVLELRLKLEDGRTFTMVSIPADVAEAIKMITSYSPAPRRQSLFAFLHSNERFKEVLGQSLKHVVVDELDRETGLYSASVVFEEDGVRISIKMIPSHAIFLALLTGKAIYVKRDLVDEQESEEEEEE
ncbi:MAG: bifunctional nuclease domain-containing protein [Acidilobaceae archaeon]